MKQDRNSPSRLALTSQEERQRFFDETRERILQSRLEDPFGQFVRDHQERFAALTASIIGDSPGLSNSNVTLTAASTSASPPDSGESGKPENESVLDASSAGEAGKNAENSSSGQQSAADLVASILNGESLNFLK